MIDYMYYGTDRRRRNEYIYNSESLSLMTSATELWVEGSNNGFVQDVEYNEALRIFKNGTAA